MKSGILLLLAGLAAAAPAAAGADAGGSGPLPSSRFFFPDPVTVSQDVIAWRRLAREDFRAGAPPSTLWLHGDRLGAVSCVFVGSAGRVPLEVELQIPSAGAARYRVRVADLRVVARFDPACSWWNPALPAEYTAYALEHEQIHFDLTELAARRLQDLLDDERDLLEARAASPERAQARIRMQLEITLRSISDDLRARHQRFDADTSGVRDAVAQERWRARLEQDLGGPPR